LMHLRGQAQLGAGMAHSFHACAGIAACFCAQALAVTRKAIPAQANAWLKQWVDLPRHLAKCRHIVEGGIAVVLRRSLALAVLQTIPKSIVRGLTQGFCAHGPLCRTA